MISVQFLTGKLAVRVDLRITILTDNNAKSQPFIFKTRVKTNNKAKKSSEKYVRAHKMRARVVSSRISA